MSKQTAAIDFLALYTMKKNSKAFTPAPKDKWRRESDKKRIFLVRGFTLIEILVAIAIVGILAAVVLVSMQSYGKKARASRAMAQASSVIPAIVSCWGNGGEVNSSGYVCKIDGSDSTGYGSWPDLPDNYLFDVAGVSGEKRSSWVFSVTNTESAPTICCNSKMASCGMPSGACSADATW